MYLWIFRTQTKFQISNFKASKNILPFVTTYNSGVPKLKEILTKNWSLITNNPNLARIFPSAPIVAYKKDKSLKDLLVTIRAIFWSELSAVLKRVTTLQPFAKSLFYSQQHPEYQSLRVLIECRVHHCYFFFKCIGQMCCPSNH